MKNQFTVLLSAVLLLIICLTGCGRQAAEAVSNSAEQEVVDLNFYIMNSVPNDQERIMDKANAIIEQEIGARLNLIMIEKPTYPDKMNLLINSKGDWDLCMTASWGGINFFENAEKGAFADLTDLIPEYAPETYSRIPEKLWEGVKVDNRIYAFVNYQQWGAATMKGFRLRKDLADESGFDWKALKGKPTLEAMEMIEPFLEAAIQKHPDMIGWETSSTYSMFVNDPLLWDMESVGDMAIPGWIRLEEPDTVINQFDTEEFREYCTIMRRWYDKGLVRKDGATLKNQYTLRQEGKYIAEIFNGWPDSIDFPESIQFEKMSMCYKEEAPGVTVSTTRLMMLAGAGSTAAVAVNAYSPNIQKAVALMELLNTNDELYLLLTQGEEGIDYIFNEEGNYRSLEGKYNFNFCEWQIAQSYSPEFTRILCDRNEKGEAQKRALEKNYEGDREAQISPLTGFVFNTLPVTVEIANCSRIIGDMLPALSAGSENPDEVLPQFLTRLKEAGIDTIIEEKQRQLDAWLLKK